MSRNGWRSKRRSIAVLQFALLISAVVSIAGARLDAQVNSKSKTLSVTGKLLSVKGQQLAIQAGDMPVEVKLVEKTIIRGEDPIKFSEITAGMYVGATARKQADGTFRASRLHVFSDDQRGVGEGHRPLSSAPGSGLTMTNANVESVEDVAVDNVKGRMLTLKYQGGELKILVPTDTLVVRRSVGDRSLLTPGVVVSVNATRAGDGSLFASQVTVRATEK